MAIRVTSYNVYMRPQRSPFFNGQAIRAKLIPSALPSSDVLVLCEVFDLATEAVLRAGLAEQYPAQTPVLGKGAFAATSGGVMLLAGQGWRIDSATEHLFGLACTPSDCAAAKGVFDVHLSRGSEHVRVLATHLNASNSKEDKAAKAARRRQFEIIGKVRSAGQGSHQFCETLLVGDLNVPPLAPEFGDLASILEIPSDVQIEGGPSYDPHSNQLAGPGASEHLDYVLRLDGRPHPSNATLRLKTSVPWKQFFFERDYYDLSDHYPVSAVI